MAAGGGGGQRKTSGGCRWAAQAIMGVTVGSASLRGGRPGGAGLTAGRALRTFSAARGVHRRSSRPGDRTAGHWGHAAGPGPVASCPHLGSGRRPVLPFARPFAVVVRTLALERNWMREGGGRGFKPSGAAGGAGLGWCARRGARCVRSMAPSAGPIGEDCIAGAGDE